MLLEYIIRELNCPEYDTDGDGVQEIATLKGVLYGSA